MKLGEALWNFTTVQEGEVGAAHELVPTCNHEPRESRPVVRRADPAAYPLCPCGESFLHSGHRGSQRKWSLSAFRVMQYPEAVSAVGPHEQECILPLRNLRQFLLNFGRRLDLVAIHFQN